MAINRIIVLFNLKPGASVAEYEAWARARDLPHVNRLSSVKSFEVFRATGVLGGSGSSPYAYIEVLDIVDMDAFVGEVATAAMKQIAAEFQAFAEPVFINTEALTWSDAA